jgi:raffinose/stachyose/melibiose transport system substrate-binding protein
VGTVNAYTEIADEWNRQNPDVQVVTTFMGDELVKPALLPALNAGTGPDMFEGGVGPGQPKAIIDAGHVLDLSPYYFSMGWDKLIPPNVVSRTSSKGKLNAIGQSVQTTVMFYNKKIFQEMGLEVPTTWEEFLKVEDALKQKYDTVVALPAGDGWPISHNQTALWGLYAGPDGEENVLYGDGRWDDQMFVDATQTLVDQFKAGYFGPDPLAVGYRDALASFFRGEIPMVFTGTSPPTPSRASPEPGTSTRTPSILTRLRSSWTSSTSVTSAARRCSRTRSSRSVRSAVKGSPSCPRSIRTSSSSTTRTESTDRWRRSSIPSSLRTCQP